MSDPKRLRANIERNKDAAKKTPTRRHSSFKWFLAPLLMVLGALILLPGKLNIFVDDSLMLKQKFVSVWLRPERWEGHFASRAEGYVDQNSMQLSTDLDIYLFLKFEPEFFDFDGELISKGFCSIGLPYANILIRGYPSYLSPNSLTLEAYEIVEGERVELGSIAAVLNESVMELRSSLFGGQAVLARDHHVLRDDLPTLCIEPLPE